MDHVTTAKETVTEEMTGAWILIIQVLWRETRKGADVDGNGHGLSYSRSMSREDYLLKRLAKLIASSSTHSTKLLFDWHHQRTMLGVYL